MSNRILFITPGLAKGGAETQMLKLASFLKSKNMEVLIISLKHIDDFKNNLQEEGIRAIFLKSNWLLFFLPNLVTLFKAIRSFKPHVLISFMFIAIIVSRLVKPFFDFKLISSVRASRIDKKWVTLFKLTSSFDDIVVYNSNTSKKNFESKKLVCKKGIIIGNAISVPNTHSINRNDHFKWISIAHFRVDKDYVTLFKAISLIKERQFSIDIVGHLYDSEWPAHMIKELGIQDHVNLLGFKTNPAEFLNKSDALILSSFSEGMPNAVLEAMAFAKPVIGSDIDSIVELLSRSKSGLLFRTGDPKDLSLKMLTIMDMPAQERTEMGNRGEKYIKDHFDENSILQQWLEILTPFLKYPSQKVSIES